MQFTRIGEFLAASHQSGSAWNLLKIRLSESGDGIVTCECLPAIKERNRRPLDEELVIKYVLAGVSQANESLGSSYCISHFQYVEDDTPPESMYEFLAKSIIEHLHSGEPWVVGGP